MKALVLVANGLQLGYVGCYGNDWIETPTLDGLAAEGVVFDQHVADRPDAQGACHAWRTGCYSFPLPEASLPAPNDDLVRLLRNRGVPTSLIRDGSRPLAAEFHREGEHVFTVPQDDGDATPLERTLEAIQQALADLAGQDRWLLWVELATLLPPWELPEDFEQRYLEEPDDDEADAEVEPLLPLADPCCGPLDPQDDLTFVRLQRTYAAAVTYLDAGLGLLLEELRETGLLDDLLLAVTTNHGLPLGEHGVVGLCRPWLHEELVHLPLLLRLPGGEEGSRRVAALTQPVDLMPTLLEFFGVTPPAVHGHSLWPLVRGQAEHVRAYACTGLRVGDALEWSLRTPSWGFLLPKVPAAEEPPRQPQLYVKPDDRWEVNDVRQHHLELTDSLEEVLHAFVAATGQPGPLVPPVLRDVGAALDENEPDPNPGGTTMATVKLVPENTDHPQVRAIFEDIKATKKIDFVPNVWRALATHPEHLELCWTRVKAIMKPGKLDLLTKEIIALAVSATNGCTYCINAHTAAVQKLELTKEQYGEVLAVIGLYCQMNALVNSLQVEPDIHPKPF